MKRYESSYTKPYGTVLVTGPTGSGKTTTLYATLNILNEATKNVITVEDPVEYQLRGINQIQVHTKAGPHLRLRAAHDPAGRPRHHPGRRDPRPGDGGHRRRSGLDRAPVLSTLHTNDAATTANRLIEMGVEPFLVGSALDCIVAQRLARRLCDRCKRSYAVEQDN